MRRWLFVQLAGCVAISSIAGAQPIPPPDFQESVVFSGLSSPTTIRFASDGRVFVAEKRGVIRVWDGLDDPSPEVFADLSDRVYNFWDRGLLGMALHPDFPTAPYVYVFYTFDGDVDPARNATYGYPPKWGSPGVPSDPCPNPPGATDRPGGCVVAARLSRLEADGNVMTGPEHVLIQDWWQQYPSHANGDLGFGADGHLYAAAGDGANFNVVDWGQYATDPPQPPYPDPVYPDDPALEGGALRSQDARTLGDALGLSGSVIRIDPATGAGVAGNPLFGSGDPNAERIVAYGLRNPFRFAVRPGTNELWISDVGWNVWEEVNRLGDHSAGPVNFGWPCFEGSDRQAGYDSNNLPVCEALYADEAMTPGTVTPPFFAYRHSSEVVAGDGCGTGNSSVTGVAFYEGGGYPPVYDGSLFFADYSRGCIWVMFASDGDPDPATRATFVLDAPNPVDLEVGPGGDLFYVDLVGGTVRRVSFVGTLHPPTAVLQADVTNGDAPLTVQFDASSSSDPDPGDTLTYAWDLDGDGDLDDSTEVSPVYVYAAPGTYTVRLEVTDSDSQSDQATVQISADNTPPAATIVQPASNLTWRVGDVVLYQGSAVDDQDGELPSTGLDWSLDLNHCDDIGNCHAHRLFDDVIGASGSFTAPDHEYPSYLTLTMTATDTGGLVDVVQLDLQPQTIELTLDSVPAGLVVGLDAQSGSAPLSDTVIVASGHSLAAPSPQTVGDTTYEWVSWSDGGDANHDVTVGDMDSTLTVTFEPVTDLDVTVSNGVTAVVPGTAVVYTAAFTNNGPSPVVGATVTVTPPSGVSGVTWSCSPAGGATCTPSGPGGVVDTVNLPVSAAVIYQLSVELPADYAGSCQVTAAVDAPTGTRDTDPSNDAATDEDPITPKADLAVTKDDGRDVAVPGQPISYAISVTNNGPSSVTEVVVVDAVPVVLVSPVFDAQSGSYDPQTGVWSGITLPPGGSIGMSLSATVSPLAEGILENTVSVAPPSGTVDPAPGNDVVSDIDVLADIRPPWVEGVGSVRRPGGGQLEAGEVVSRSVTQLTLRYSEPMHDPPGDVDPRDVTNVDSYRLYGGPQGAAVHTTSCGPPAGADVSISVDEALFDPATRTVVLHVNDRVALPDRAYRLIGCGDALADEAGNALDGDGDGLGGDDFSIDFRVNGSNLVRNPNIDRDLRNWDVGGPGVTHDPVVDVDLELSSGAIHLSDAIGVGPWTVSQCVQAPLEGVVEAGAWVRTDSATSDGPTVSLTTELFASSACSGSPALAPRTTIQTGDGGDGWRRMLQRDTVDTFVNVDSVRVTISVAPGGGPFDVFVDDIALVRIGVAEIFADEFETGDTLLWSRRFGRSDVPGDESGR